MVKIVTPVFIKKVGAWGVQHGPELLTATAAIGTVTSVVLAVRATPKVFDVVNEQHPETRKDLLKATWKLYIPTAISTAGTIACIIGSNRLSAKHIASLTGICSLTATAFEEYKSKVVETIGEKKEELVRQSVAQDHINANPPTMEPEEVGNGTRRYNCCEQITGQYFLASYDQLRNANSDLRDLCADGNQIDLNDVFENLNMNCGAHLRNSKIGDSIMFEHYRGDFFHIHCCMDDKMNPCYEIEYSTTPTSAYDGRPLMR